MSRWTAVSDRDYFDEIEGRDFHHVAKRMCAKCGRPVWVSLTEPYTVQVCCDRCQQKEAKQ